MESTSMRTTEVEERTMLSIKATLRRISNFFNLQNPSLVFLIFRQPSSRTDFLLDLKPRGNSIPSRNYD